MEESIDVLGIDRAERCEDDQVGAIAWLLLAPGKLRQLGFDSRVGHDQEPPGLEAEAAWGQDQAFFDRLPELWIERALWIEAFYGVAPL